MLNLHPNELFAGRYLLRKRLGHGGFSEVWLAHNERAGFEQAIKIYTGLDVGGNEVFRREFARVYHLAHHNLLRATEFDIYDGHPYLVMPYCSKGSALDRLGRMSERELAQVMRDIGAALAFIHSPSRHVVHKDVKPDNIMINDQGEYLLSDFGISSELRQQLKEQLEQQGSIASSGAGLTPMAYRAPEYFDATRAGQEPIIASDVWAFGATLYELATGQQPFGNLGGSVQFSDPEPPNLPSRFSRPLSRIIQHCLAKDPWDRPSASTLRKLGSEYLSFGRWPSPYADEPAPAPKPRPQPRPEPTPRPGPILGGGIKKTKPGRREKPLKPAVIAGIVLACFLLIGGMYAVGEKFIWGSGQVAEAQDDLTLPQVNTAVISEEGNDSGPAGEAKEEKSRPEEANVGATRPPELYSNQENKKPERQEKKEEQTAKEPTKKTAPEPSPSSDPYTFPSPFVQDEPSDQSGVACKVKIKEVYLGTNNTVVEMNMKNCRNIDLFEQGNTHAFYILAGSREYKLQRVEGIRTGENIDAGSNIDFKLYFQPLPRTTRTFDLIEGKAQMAEIRTFWNFKGVHLSHD